MLVDQGRDAFAEDRNTRPQRFFRIINEVPTLLMIAIVILVVVKLLHHGHCRQPRPCG